MVYRTLDKARAAITVERLIAAVMVLLIALLLWDAISLAYHKAYAIDEFLYVHRAWQILQPGHGLGTEIASGRPFVHALLNTPFVAMGGDDPANMIYVRLGTLLWFAMALLLIAVLSRRPRSKAWPMLTAVVLALATRHFVWYETEIRPDGIALVLALATVWVLSIERLPDRVAAAAAGVLLLLACFASKKAIVYSSVFALAFVADLSAWRRLRPQILRSAGVFSASFIGALLVVLAVAFASGGSLSEFWQGFYQRVIEHERFYPGFSPARFFDPFFNESWAVCGLGLYGVWTAALDAGRRWRDERVVSREWLLIALAISTWASFFAQKAAFTYSLLPGMALMIIFAARGIMVIAARFAELGERREWIGGGLAVAMLLVVGYHGHQRLQPESDNHRQIQLQRQIGELVAPGETVYDMSSSFVYRPRAHRFAFVDNSRKKQFKEQLSEEIPVAIIDKQAMLMVYDVRVHSWRNTSLGRWFREHFHRINNDLYVWGAKFEDNASAWTEQFNAIKAGRYFVHPANAMDSGTLEIDGKPIDQAIFELDRGNHRVRWTPRTPAAPRRMYVLWLPRNGKTFNPDGKFPTYELGHRVLP